MMLSFNNTEKYPKDIAEDLKEIYISEYTKTINNEKLNVELQSKFLPFFDVVISVDVQKSDNIGYYYLIFGEKDGKEVVQGVKINEQDAQNETYTYINFNGLNVNELTQYCYETGPQSGCDNIECHYYPSGPPAFCKLIICGVYPNCAQ